MVIIMKKRILVPILIIIALLTGCTHPPEDTSPLTEPITSESTTLPQQTDPEHKKYPANTGIDFMEFAPLVPDEIYSTPAEENGLDGTVYMILGTVEGYTTSDGITCICVDTIDHGKVLIGDPVAILQSTGTSEYGKIDFEKMRTYFPLPEVGEYMTIFAEYQGMSGKYNCPTFIYTSQDYLLKAILLSTEEIFTGDPVDEPSSSPAEQGTLENPYNEGMYKVGSDIAPGEYVFLTQSSSSSYICVSSDSNQDDIIENAIFTNSYFMTIEDGQYIEASDCLFFKAEGYMLTQNNDGVIPEGMYRVGIDIDAGEYKVVTEGDDSGYWCIFTSSKIPQDIYSNHIFENSTYLTLTEGQYVYFNDCTASKQS